MKQNVSLLLFSLVMVSATVFAGAGIVVQAQEEVGVPVTVVDSPDPVDAGDAVQFTISWTDDLDEMNSAMICKSHDVVDGECLGGYWVEMSPLSTSPINLFYTPLNADAGTQTYFAVVCDASLVCTEPVSETFTVIEGEGGVDPGGDDGGDSGSDTGGGDSGGSNPPPEGPPTDAPAGYIDGDLVQVSGHQAVYVVQNGVFVGIPDVSTFNARRYNWDDIITIPYSEIGDIVPAYTFYPEGATIRAIGDIDVWIVKYAGEKQFRRLVLNPTVFNSYGHLRWEDVRDVSAASVNAFMEATLVYVVGSPDQVYRLTPDGDIGTRQRITSDYVVSLGLDAEGTYEINATDYANYTEGTPLE